MKRSSTVYKSSDKYSVEFELFREKSERYFKSNLWSVKTVIVSHEDNTVDSHTKSNSLTIARPSFDQS